MPPLAGADAIVTFKIGADAITGGAVTIANANSAAQDLDYAWPTAANVVQEYNVIEVDSGGESSTTAPITAWVVIRPH